MINYHEYEYKKKLIEAPKSFYTDEKFYTNALEKNNLTEDWI
jgi:hypothetical protein